MKIYKKKNISLNSRKTIGGYLFTLPFIIGFLFFFLYPLLQSVIFSLSKLEITNTGYNLNFIKLTNYYHILLEDPNFLKTLVSTVITMVTNVPLTLAFSFFAAIILNQKFKGRMLARVIFFLPVIYSAGIILRMESTDYLTQIMTGTQGSGNQMVFSGAALRDFLLQTKLPAALLNYLLIAVNRIPTIIKSSGIQILIFLAGLQSISPSIYEAANVEGATPWESFWLITLPMLSPLILTNTAYTIIDSFTSAENQLLGLIKSTAFTGAGYGVSMAMAITYFLIVILLLGIIFKTISNHIFYQE